MLKLKDILRRYDVNRAALWRWRKNLGFPAPITPPNARPIWRLEDIEQWEESNKINATAST